jgi:hypothetical protein
LDAARKGNVVTIPQIAKKLRQMPEFAGMDTSTICRRLNGKLPLDKAKDMRGLANTGAQRHRWKN